MKTDSYSTSEVAEILGVSSRRVRALVAQYDLDAERVGNSLRIDPLSLARLQTSSRSASRSLSPRMCWAALLTKFGTVNVADISDAFALSASERGRLVALAHRHSHELPHLVKRRAKTTRWSVRTNYLASLLALPNSWTSGESAIKRHNVNLTIRPDRGELYVFSGHLDDITKSFSLRKDDTPNLVIHELPDFLTLKNCLATIDSLPAVVTAFDLIDSGEPRTRTAGIELLNRQVGFTR